MVYSIVFRFILLCSKNRWVTGEYELKAANIKKGVTIFGIIGTYDGFPTPVEDADGNLTVTLFENGKFLYGGITEIRLCRHSETSSGAPKDVMNSNLYADSYSWVSGAYPSIGSSIRTCGTYFWKWTGSRGALAWLLQMKLPVIKKCKDLLFQV